MLTRFRIFWLILFGLPAFGQVSLTLEPMAVKDARDLLGLNGHTVWTVYVLAPMLVTSLPRQDVTSLTPISELSYEGSLDLLSKAGKVNGVSVAGKVWDVLGPLAGTALSIYGITQGSPNYIYASGGIGVLGFARKLAADVEPNVARYTPLLLPETIPCKDGRCGAWYIITEKLPNPARMEIASTHNGAWIPASFDLKGPTSIAVPTSAKPDPLAKYYRSGVVLNPVAFLKDFHDQEAEWSLRR